MVESTVKSLVKLVLKELKMRLMSILFVFAVMTELVEAKPPSLENIGSSCYMNALLQAMLNIPQLNTLVMQHGTGGANFGGTFLPAYTRLVEAVVKKQPIGKGLLEGLHRGFELEMRPSPVKNTFGEILNMALCPDCINVEDSKKLLKISFEGVIAAETGKGKAAQQYVIDYFNEQIKNLPNLNNVTDVLNLLQNLPEQFNKKTEIAYGQQDADELYGKLIENFIDKTLSSGEFIKSFSDLLEVVRVAEGKQTGSGNFMRYLYIDWGLKPKTLYDLLEKGKNDGCFTDGSVNALGAIQAPKVLVFVPMTDVFNAIVMPEQIDMEPYHKVFKGITYDLVSVVVWGGGLGKESSFGHYTAYVNDLSADDTTWYYCDDSTIKLIGRELLEEDHRRIDTRSRMLFYMKTSEVETLQPKLKPRRQLIALSQSLASLLQDVKK